MPSNSMKIRNIGYNCFRIKTLRAESADVLDSKDQKISKIVGGHCKPRRLRLSSRRCALRFHCVTMPIPVELASGYLSEPPRTTNVCHGLALPLMGARRNHGKQTKECVLKYRCGN